MKILILSPHIDAQHPVVQALKARGDAVLVSSQSDEAWKVLQVHGASMDIAILHREGSTGGDPGTELNKKIKKTSTFADLPVLFTSESWSDEQCAIHQQTPEGANAYLHWPFDGKKLIETIEAIFGPEASMEHPSADGVNAPTLSIIAPVPKMDMSSMVLEEPSQIFDKLPGETTNSGIHLSNFEGKPEGTNVRLEPQSTAAVAAPKPPVAESKPSDVSKLLLQPNTAAPLDLLDVSLSEPSVAQPAPPPPAVSEGGLDLLSVEEEKPGDPPSFAPSSDGTGVSIDIGSAPPLAPPVAMVPGQLQALEPPDVDETRAKATLESESPNDSPSDSSGSDEAVIEKELPYLFNKSEKTPHPTYSHPVGDSVVPGGAANAPDLETLKKYLLLREQDVAALSGQLKATREENAGLSQRLREEKDRADGLDLLADDQKRQIEEFEKEKAIALEALNTEIAELRFQTKAKTDKAKLLEAQVNQASQEIERLKDRVRSDIRKIRVRERELENQLEMAKKDTEVVLGAREGKIVELKRKIDLLEFNMDLLQDRFNRERESNNKLREKLGKAAQVVRVAEGLLDEPQATSLKDAAGTLTAGKSHSEKAS
jgi:hypothetical protein